MMIAVLPRMTCESCALFIDPGESYVVSPDIAGVGPGTVTCLRCGPEDERLACQECRELIGPDDRVIHTACAGEDDDE